MALFSGVGILEKRYWTTGGIDPAARVQFWNAVLLESINELDFEADDAEFEAELEQHTVGPLKLNSVTINTGHTVTRSCKGISRSRNTPGFHLNYVKEGSFTVVQGRREATLVAGECILIDARQPYRVFSSERTKHICLHLPVDWLQSWLPHPTEFVVRPIKRGMPWSGALVASLNDARLIADMPDGLHHLCADQLAGALALALGPCQGESTAHGRKIYMRLMEVLTEMSHDPELDAQKVADALSISPRYLYKILSSHNTTYSRELVRIRLERAARMLKDRRFDDLSIAEIAWRSGFRDPSHFSKRFHMAYKMTPGAYRNASR